MSQGKTNVINDKVYFGGGGANNDDEYSVYCYDPLQDRWITLPPLPVVYFGLGQVNGKLVAVGGVNKGKRTSTNEVYTYNEQSQMWKQTIPPMPTARHFPGVLSLQSALIVAGGYTLSSLRSMHTDAVEIFKPDTSQWYSTDPLPVACQDISIVAVGNMCTCYALSGCGCDSIRRVENLNQALYASVDDLLHNALPANEITHSGSSVDAHSAWNNLSNTPTYAPAAAMLAGNLLAIGGCSASDGGANEKEIYMYSPSTNSWIYISDLPAPRSDTTVAVLSSAEILVIGGWSDLGRVNTVYKGTLHLKP